MTWAPGGREKRNAIARSAPWLAAALATVLAGCDPPPRVELVNGADAPVSMTHVPSVVFLEGYKTDTTVRVAPGSTGRFILPTGWLSGGVTPSVAFRGCAYAYQIPAHGGDALDAGIGQWNGLQFGRDGGLYLRERHPAGVAPLSALGSHQPAGWPLRPTRRSCP